MDQHTATMILLCIATAVAYLLIDAAPSAASPLAEWCRNRHEERMKRIEDARIALTRPPKTHTAGYMTIETNGEQRYYRGDGTYTVTYDPNEHTPTAPAPAATATDRTYEIAIGCRTLAFTRTTDPGTNSTRYALNTRRDMLPLRPPRCDIQDNNHRH